MLNIEERKETTNTAAPTDALDPYLCHVEMGLAAVFYPLGFPLHLKTNSQEVIDGAQESWGAFRQEFDIPALRLQVGVLDDEAVECPPGPIFRAHGGIITGIADQGNFCVSDVFHGFSFAWVTRATASRKSYLRYHYLEAAALAHIANRHTAPIHAACVQLNGRGVLLCGDSGAGKSSLSFACARAGWTFISDDASFLLNDRKARRVVGNCHLIRLRPSAVDLFPEARDKPLTPRAGSKPSIELFTATVPGIRKAGSADVDYVVFLNRSSGGAQEIVPLSKEAARDSILQRLSGLEDLRRTQVESIDRLLTAEVLEIRYRDLDWAVDRLTRLVREPGE
ncbi:MAG TPA: aldolase [Acidobacteriaceae bacterium]|jgi:hypothetical protein